MAKFPDWIVPMAATLTQERFTGPEWSFERKFDGIRLLAYKKGKQVELFSRNRLPQNIPAISNAIAKLPHRELILDGEITWHAPFSYHVFDIMWIDGRETMSLPLEERRALLKQLPLTAPLRRVAELKMSVPISPSSSGRALGEGGAAIATRSLQWGSSPSVSEAVSEPRAVATGSSDNLIPWELARQKGWEGVIAKRRGSIYEQRRSRNWLKMKCELAQEFVVGGFTDPQGKRVGLGALLVGYYERGASTSVSDGLSEPRAVATGSGDNLDVGSEPPASARRSSASISSPSGRGRVRTRSVATGLVSEPRAVATGFSDKRTYGGSPNLSEGSGAERERRSSSRSEGASRSAQPDFVFAGKIGTGFNNDLLVDLRAQLDKLEISNPPFTKAVSLPRLRAHWVRPEIVVQIGFIQWTKYNKLRHPRLLGIRTDKDPHEVVREQ